jgi:hypothetical protein
MHIRSGEMVTLGAQDDFFSGAVGIFLALAVLAVAVTWVIFPFIVVAKFNDVIRVINELKAVLEKYELRTTKIERPVPMGQVPIPQEEKKKTNGGTKVYKLD